ncbi:MAG: hypothetical protein HY903_21485 [Deltaproteobacteria bacterium]|nr:hypothetical protein [Deltaproteobacteria bacterium]
MSRIEESATVRAADAFWSGYEKWATAMADKDAAAAYKKKGHRGIFAGANRSGPQIGYVVENTYVYTSNIMKGPPGKGRYVGFASNGSVAKKVGEGVAKGVGTYKKVGNQVQIFKYDGGKEKLVGLISDGNVFALRGRSKTLVGSVGSPEEGAGLLLLLR